MRGFGRWTVSDAFGGRWTFVLSARASAEERARALPAHAAERDIDRMFSRDRDLDRSVLIELGDVPAFDARHYARDQLKALVKRRVGPLGRLLLFSERQ